MHLLTCSATRHAHEFAIVPPASRHPPSPHRPRTCCMQRNLQCAANCASCSTAGAGACDAGSCVTGFGLTPTSTCAAVRQRAPFDLLRNPACARIRPRASSKPPPTLTPLPAHAPQCAPNCASCSTAGAGACDAGSCVTGYGLTSTSTCAAVRRAPCPLVQSETKRAIHANAPQQSATHPHPISCSLAAVCGQLRRVCKRWPWQVRCWKMLEWLWPDFHLHMRSGASACTF